MKEVHEEVRQMEQQLDQTRLLAMQTALQKMSADVGMLRAEIEFLSIQNQGLQATLQALERAGVNIAEVLEAAQTAPGASESTEAPEHGPEDGEE